MISFKILVALQFLTIFSSPLYIIRFHLFDVPATLLEVFILLTFFVFVVHLIKNKVSLKSLKTNFSLPALILLLAATLSVLISPDKLGGLGILKAYFLEPVMFFYSLNYSLKKVGDNFIYLSMILVGLSLSILAILQKITGQFSLAPGELALGRVTALYNSANSFSLFLIPIIFLTIAYLKSTNLKILKVSSLLAAGLFLLVVFWTKSRGGVVGLTVAFLTYGYLVKIYINKLAKQFRWLIPAVFLGLIGLVLIYLYQSYNFFPPTYGQAYTRPDTMQIRFYIWYGAINLLKEQPILGAGLNGFKTLYTNQYRMVEFQEEFQYPHNLILTLWSETSILGLFAFMGILVILFRRLVKKLDQGNYTFKIAAILSIFVYLLVHGLVDVPYFKNDLSFQFWVLLSLADYYIGKV